MITLNEPGMCLAPSVMLLWYQVRIIHISGRTAADFMLPCLLMYDTTEVLSEAMMTNAPVPPKD